MMSKHLKLLLILIALFLIAGLIFHFRVFLFINVMEPVALVIWTFWTLISGIDQRMCWGGVIVLCVMITLRLIPSSETKLRNPAYDYESRPQNQVDYWQGIIECGDHDHLKSELKTLLMKIAAKSNDYKASESDEVNISFTTLSVETQEYLINTRKKQGVLQGSIWHGLKSVLSRLFPWWSEIRNNKEIRIIAEVIQWMETELDINYEK